jgi:quinol monooxygenase YgiN
MIALLVELTAKSAKVDQVEQILQELVDISALERDTLFYSANRSSEKSNAFILYELYTDDAAKGAHMSNPNVLAALGQLEGLLAEPPRLQPLHYVRGCGVSVLAR